MTERSCVVQLVNTNEAAANRAIAKAEDEGADLDDLDMTPSEVLMNYLQNSFPVQAYEEYTDDKGNKQSRPVLDSEGNAVPDRQAVRKRDALIAEIRQMKVPDGPLELLFDAFGPDEVAEVTGRSRRVVEKPDENGHLHRVVEKRSKASGLADTQMFQDGKKRILIFSDAGGTGKSYHADLRAKNQQQRVHYLLQPGWDAKKAVQGFGRTHRSNEASAPIYKLVTTNIMGQKRFTSTIARRLDQLGALTKGQRNTGSGMFGEKDNLENPIAQDALEQYYRVMPVDSVKKLGLYDKLYNEFGVYQPDQGTARDIGRFLNRILALEVEEQNRVFQGFYDTFDRMMDAAISDGTVDMGLENYAADKIDVQDEKVIRKDPTGADTKYVQLTAYRKPNVIQYADLKNFRDGFQGIVKTDDGSVRAVYRISDKTNAKGEVENRYKLQAPSQTEYSVYVQNTLDRKTEAVPKTGWKAAWDAELEKIPKYTETKLHLLTGALLPIWDKLPATNTRVMRLITSDGKQYLGRLIRATDIDSVLRGLGTERTRETYTPKQIADSVLKNGQTAVLRDDKWRLVRSRVSGEYRIEIKGDNVWYAARQYPGMITERIGYEYRYFIPVGDEKPLRDLIENNPVVEIQNRREDSAVDKMIHTGDSGLWSASRVGDGGKAPLPLSDIVEKIRHDFQISVTTGHIRGNNIAGQYDRNQKGIRSKVANNLPAISHELGHHLDNEYGITGKLSSELRNELIGGLDADAKAAYPEKKWVTEGLAEFVRKFLQNRETAAIDYPEFFKHFENSIPAQDNALLDRLADEVNAYDSLDSGTAVSSIRFSEERGADFRTNAEKIKDAGDEFYQAWVDGNYGIQLFDQATGAHVYKLASNAAYADAVAGSVLTGDLTSPDGRYVAPGLTTALHGVNLKDKREYREFGEYLVVKHGPERLKEGMRVFADDRKNSTAWMNGRQAELERDYPAFKPASERLYQFEEDFLQTWGVGTGLVSKESAENWRKRWKYYVPFNRKFLRGGSGVRRGFANQTSTIRKAHGSGLDILCPVDGIITNVVKMVNAGMRNNVMVQLTSTAEKIGGCADLLEKVPMPVRLKTFDTTGLKKDLKKALDANVEERTLSREGAEAAYGVIGNIDEILTQYGKGKAGGDVVTVLKGGRQEFWKINDPMLLSSVTNMDGRRLPAWLEAYGAISRFITSNITGNNVIWSIFSNAPRDLMTFWTFSEDKNLFHLLSRIGNTYLNQMKGKNADPMYKEYLAMGGGKVSVYSADRNLAKGIRKRITGDKTRWLNPMEWISFVSDTIETGPRYSYYRLLRQKGSTPEEAFYESTDITVNFRRGGVQARTLNRVIPFFNAGVQGIDKFARWVTADEVPNTLASVERQKVIRGRMLAFLAASAGLAALFYGINSKSKEDQRNYALLSTYMKNSYWCIPLGGGKYFTIPKPREIAVVSSLMEAAMEEYGSGNRHALDDFYQYVTDTCLPNVVSDIAQWNLGGAAGDLGFLGTIGRMYANRDFLGKPIVSSGLQNLEPRDQYTGRTSKLAVKIGKAFNVSPQMTDYFFNNTLGGWWKYQKALFPLNDQYRDKTLGVQSSYERDNLYSNDLVNWLYDTAEKSSKHSDSNPGDTDEKIRSRWDSLMTTFWSTYNQLDKDKGETEAIRDARKTALEMIIEYRRTLENGRGGYERNQREINKICRAANDTQYLPSDMPSSVRDAKENLHVLSGSSYVEYQTDYLSRYWDYVESGLGTAGDAAQKQAVVRAAKQQAKQQATRAILGKIGYPAELTKIQRGQRAGYSSVPEKKVVEFHSKVAVAASDGHLKQDEVVRAIEAMKGLTDAQRSALFHSRYQSNDHNPWA